MKTIAIKRIEAAERQERHDALTPQDKLAKLAQRPGKSAKEIKRLTGRTA